MDPERWQQVERVYNSAVELKPSDRQAYLEKACAGDDELRREVEKLISFDRKAGRFMESPALDVAAKALARNTERGKSVDFVGQTFLHYRVTEKIGEGGMGVVYKALDTHLKRPVAIRVLLPERVTDPERLRRFEQEARSASALDHPNIVTIHDIGKHEDTPYIVMEFVEGKTLREIVAEGPLPTKKLLRLATQIAEGLAKAHSAGIVHRDLKPENLMVTSDAYVKILDFGLAKLMPESVDTHSEMLAPTMESTSPGAVVGTVGYMSPEQASGRKADYRADQFSLGLILYEMATGKGAFRRDTIGETLAAIIREEPEPIAKVNPNLPAPLRWIVECCLAKLPEERYVSTSDIAKELQDLRDHLSEVPSEPVEVPPAHRRTFTRTSLVAAAGLLVMAFALVLGLNVAGLKDRLLGETSPAPIGSLAVLPLENLSGDPEQEYFAEGMTDALIANLAKIGALRVISRQSVMRFKGTDIPLPEIAEALKVDAVVEGSVVCSGDRVRITTQLVQAAPERHLWDESYERDLENVLSLQGEVARAIAEQIKVAVSPEEAGQLTPSPRVNPEAYRLYLQGNYHLCRRTIDALQNAQSCFQQAIQADPEYAPSHAGLASALTELGDWNGPLPPSAVHAPAKAEAQKAIDLDGRLAEGHIALARIKELFEWDWAGAEAEFKQGMQLGPISTPPASTTPTT